MVPSLSKFYFEPPCKSFRGKTRIEFSESEIELKQTLSRKEILNRSLSGLCELRESEYGLLTGRKY